MKLNNLYKNFSFLISNDIKIKIFWFLIISFLFLFFNLFSFSLLIPFFSSLIDNNLISELSFFNFLKEFDFFKVKSDDQILKSVGFIALAMIILSNYLLYLNEKFKFQLISIIAKSITYKFITSFLEIKFSEFTKYKKNLVVSKLLIELESVVIQIFYNSLELISRIFIVIIIFIALLFFEPLITLISFFSIILIFSIVYNFFKNKFKILGHKMVEGNSQRSLFLNEIINNFMNLKINNMAEYFKNKFLEATNKYYSSLSNSEIAKKIPKTMIEASFFSVIILISILLINNDFSNMNNLVISFSAFALASYKIMPSIQQIFFSISTIKNSLPKLYSLSNELKKIKGAKKRISSSTKVNYLLNPVIEAKNLQFSFNGKIIINNLNFKIYKNSITCISGKSGSGKTTLINSILGLTEPTKGKIEVYGKKPSILSDNLVSKIFSYAPQLTSLFHFNLKKNIYLNNYYSEKKIRQSLRFSNFSKLSLLKFNQSKRNLSGGEIKRILISRAIYNNSNILILDEPTVYLDKKNVDTVIESIRLIKNKTVIITSHNEKLKKISNKVIYL